MDNLLSYAYLEERCSICLTVVPVTLYEILLEQQVQRDWRPIRPCEGCTVPLGHATRAVPEGELAQLAAAWDALSSSLHDHRVTLRLGVWPAGGSSNAGAHGS